MQNVYYKNYFSGKPSYSVTKTMKFITTFDKKCSKLLYIHAIQAKFRLGMFLYIGMFLIPVYTYLILGVLVMPLTCRL